MRHPAPRLRLQGSQEGADCGLQVGLKHGFLYQVIFLTKRLAGMSEDDFVNQQKTNIRKGNEYGVRISPAEAEEDIGDRELN